MSALFCPGENEMWRNEAEKSRQAYEDYRHMNPAYEELRLIRLLPATARDPTLQPDGKQDVLACELRHFSVQDPRLLDNSSELTWRFGEDVQPAMLAPQWRYPWGDYAALSYTWGNPNDTRQIIVDGCRVVVRSNLEAALRALAATAPVKAGLWLWIDALCINQEDLTERSTEVPRMRKIYTMARDVVVWLGEDSDNSDQAVKLVRTMAGACRDGTAIQLGQRLRNDPKALGFGCWRALSYLMSRPYWNRLWIMQEIAMGRPRSPILCGMQLATWEDFYLAIYTFLNPNVDIVFSCIETELRAAGHDMASGPGGLNRNRIIHLGKEQSIRAKDQTLHPNLMPLLDLGRKSLASDDRDNVYGLLGLLPTAIATLIKVDYTIPASDVYASFARAMITGMRSLAILEQCTGPRPDLPSWAPDWREKDHFRLFSGRCNYNAGGSTMPSLVGFSEDGKALRCEVLLIDTLDGLGASYFENSRSDKAQDAVFQPQNANNPYASGDGLRDALWRTLVGDRTPQGKRPPKAYETLLDCSIRSKKKAPPSTLSRGRKAFNQVVAQNASLKISGCSLESFFAVENTPDSEAASDAMERVFRLHRSRRLGITSKGYLCLVPTRAQNGDRLCILKGCPVPLVLRSNLLSDFIVVGACYIHGFMEEDLRSVHLHGMSPKVIWLH